MHSTVCIDTRTGLVQARLIGKVRVLEYPKARTDDDVFARSELASFRAAPCTVHRMTGQLNPDVADRRLGDMKHFIELGNNSAMFGAVQ